MFFLCVECYLYMFELVKKFIMQLLTNVCHHKKGGIVSPMVPLIEVLMITNKGYWLLMVNIKLR